LIGFILSAGLGSRMGELTKNTPKPLLKINGKTLLDHSIDFGKSLGISEFILNTHYLSEQIIEHIQKYSDLKIHISHEEKLLGTAGGLKTGIEGIIHQENFLVMNPDILFQDFDLITLKKNIEGFNQSCLLFLSEKPKGDKNTSLALEQDQIEFGKGNLFYIGLSVIHPKIFDKIKINQYSDLSEIFKDLSSRKLLNGAIFPGKAIDLGDKEKYFNFIS
jgi:N-acetyl-alpha-D-muramate 1-phosphate uridylyltransferase